MVLGTALLQAIVNGESDSIITQPFPRLTQRDTSTGQVL